MIVRRWLDFFFAPIEHGSLAIARVTIGFCLCFAYLETIPYRTLFFGAKSFMGHQFFSTYPSAEPFHSMTTANFRFLQSVSTDWPAQSLLFVVIFSALAFVVGFRTKTFGAILFVGHILLHSQFEFFTWGWGYLIKPFLLILILADSGKFYSIDAKFRTGRFAPEMPGSWVGEVWPLRLIQLHIALIYLVAAWIRIGDPNWLDGTMLQEILSESTFNRYMGDISSFKHVTVWICYAFWGLELAAPLLLWFRPAIKPVVIALACMHIGLQIFSRVGYWNFMILGLLPTLWVLSGHNWLRGPDWFRAHALNPSPDAGVAGAQK